MSPNRALTLQRDLEAVGDGADRSRNQPAPAPGRQLPQSQGESAPNVGESASKVEESAPKVGESNFGDSSGALFSMYFKAAEEEDNKMADRWQKDAEGLLIFTGLFSAAVAALLSVSLQSLIPNSQDTSSFYLGNIYQVLADPNATRPSIPAPISKPPQFSPPRYAIWVNSLWFLSLLISLTCAMLATSSQQWARRYIRVTQPARCKPEKRARMRAFFATGAEKTHIASVVDGLPSLVHLSLFLFFAGVAVFLFHINHSVFISVAWWIGLFSIIYGLITLMPIIRHDSPFYSPLSLPAWFLYASISYFIFNVFFSIRAGKIVVFKKWQGLRALKDRYRRWILGGVEKAAEETASNRSSEIDNRILGWTIDALDDDDILEEFFETIPNFFNSKLVKDLKTDFSKILLKKFWKASNGFHERNLLSDSVSDDTKSRRLDIGMKAMNVISNLDILSIPHDILFESWDQVPQNVEMGYTLAPWCTNDNRNIALYAQCIATRILATVWEHNDRWIGLATRVLGLSEQNLRSYIAHGDDSVSLAILIRVARRHFHTDFYDWGILSRLSELNVHNTLPGLQHEFCTLWNESVHEAEHQGSDSYAVGILRLTRHLYTDLHYRPDAAPPRFFAATGDFDHILFQPDSYSLCNIRGHGTDSTDSHAVPHSARFGDLLSASPGGSAAPQLAENIVGNPLGSGQIISSDARETSQPPTATSQLMAAPWVTSDIRQISSTAPTYSPGALSATLLNEPLASSHAGPASNLLPVSSTIPTSPPSPNAELLALLSGAPLSNPPDNATLPRLRTRGLINQGNMSFVNTVLQLLVHCPPFWNQSKELGRLMSQGGRGKGQQSGSSTTVLVDATVRLLNEFVYKEKPPLTQPSPRLAEKGKAREDEDKKEEDDDTDPFIPTYMYDAMKEKRQFKNMLDGRQQDAEEFFSVYLDALDEELLGLLTSVIRHKSASPGLNVEEVKDGTQSRSGHFEASSARSPISRIFDGKFRTTVRMAGRLDTIIIDGWRSLQLDIQPDSIHTIQDALANISQPQTVQVSPTGLSRASQKVTVLIEALPPVLVIHLKRFLYDAATGGVVKIGKPVEFSPELEVPLGSMAPAAGQPAPPARYTLCGVLYHHGRSARGGHYTVDVLAHGNSGEAWLHIDDETVSTVRHEEVFRIQDDERADDRCAYMLFYRHAAPTQR